MPFNLVYWHKLEVKALKALENKLIEEFKNRAYFSRTELFDFYLNFEPELKEGTFAWRIYDLKNKNIIRPIKRGIYVISYKPRYKPRYKPNISPRIEKIGKLLSERFPDIRHCIWETSWLNEFTRHQMSKSTLLIEIEKGLEESLFYELKDQMHGEVFLNPDKRTLDFYVAESNQPVVIKRLLTRSPLSKRTEKKIKLFIPALEKIMVDIYTEEKLFYYLKGSELIHIFESAIESYIIDFTKLFSYAKRRQRENEIKLFMFNHMPHLVKDIIDD